MEAAIRFVDPNGAELAQPGEWQPAGVVIDCPPDRWESARLTAQGIPLQLVLKKLGGETVIYAEWQRAGAGHYRLLFEADDARGERILTITPEKLSGPAFDAMLTDLDTRLPLSIALRLKQGGGLAGYHLPEPHESTIAQEVQRLVRAIRGTDAYHGLVPILRQLAADPHITLSRTVFWQQAERARRPPVRTIRQAMLVPGNLDAVRRPLRVIDERIDPDVDTAENRLLRLFHDQVERRLRRLLAHRDLGESWYADLSGLSSDLRRARRAAGWLDDVRADAPPLDRVSMVQLKRPPYRSAISGWLEFHRSVTVRFEDPALDAPLQEIPHLYERWGTLFAIDVLLEVAQSRGYRPVAERLFGRDDEGIFMKLFPNTEAVRLRHPVRGDRVRLLVQPPYGKSVPLRSVTYQQRPDVAIELLDASGHRELILLDPKYKLARDDGAADDDEESINGWPTKTDIDKMHAYRDAICDAGGRRVVSHAAILYPGPEVHWDAGIGAYSAVPGNSDGLRASLMQRIAELLDRA